MADSSSTAGSDFKLDSLQVQVKDQVGTLADLVAKQTRFLDLPSNQIFGTPPSISGSDDLAIDQTKLAVSASAAYNATAFVHPQDVDPDGIVTTGADDAWLKQELALSASVSGTQGNLTFGLATASASGAAKGNVRLLDYRQHSIQDLVGQAVIDGITGARFAVRAQDVAQLDAGSRLAFLAGGSLALNVKLSVADTLSASLTALDRALGATGAAAIQFQTGGTCTLAVGLSDDFRLVFSRAASGRIEVDVKKAVNSSVRLTGSYGVTAQFANPQGLAAALHAYVKQRLGVAYTDYQKVEQAVCGAGSKFSSLSPEIQALAEQIAGTLGLGDAEQKFSDLKTRICGLDKKLQDAITAAVTARLRAAFTFTWSRVTSNQAVLSFEIDPAALPTYLRGLLFGDLSPALEALEDQDPRFTLINYLETRKGTIDRAFGFSLSLGKWSVGSQTDFQITWETDIRFLPDGGRGERRALEGRYAYTSKWLRGQTETYFVDLGATMPGFAASPALADFQYGLHLSWTWQEKHSPALAARWADLAELWGSQPALAGAVAGADGKDVEAVVEVVLGNEGVLAVARAASGQDPRWLDSWGWALAAALPPIPDLGFRHSVQDRLRLYLQSAKNLLRQDEIVNVVTVPAYDSAQERAQLEPIDLAGLGQPIEGLAVTFEMFGLHTIWRPDSAVRRPSKLFKDVQHAFAALVGGGNYRPAIEGLISQLNTLVAGDPFWTRLLGAALTHFLRQAGQAALFTTSARYTAGTSTTLATAGS